ncbi:MAG: hypothetical protein GXP13_02220, partial [Gammaproteobacteria bacterium]|nr:hypothetical protein [Gammaproteobacteria bacterium]
MSSKKYGQSLHLQPRSSRHLSMVLFFLHGLALVVAANLTVPGWISIILSVAILANFYMTFTVHILGRGKSALLSMVWDDNGDWTLINGEREELRASLLPSSYVHTQLIVLNFLIEQGG